MNSTVIIADDHPLFRDALQQSISEAVPDCDIRTVGELDALRTLLTELGSADFVMLDLSMPGASGISGLVTIRGEFPDTPVIVVSASEDASTIAKCIEMGASGFIPKSSGNDNIAEGINAVLSGEVWVPPDIDLSLAIDPESTEMMRRLQSLTPQQRRVLSMLGEGLLNKQIAYELDVSEATVKAHVSAVLLKLGVDSRTQAVIAINKIDAGILESH